MWFASTVDLYENVWIYIQESANIKIRYLLPNFVQRYLISIVSQWAPYMSLPVWSCVRNNFMSSDDFMDPTGTPGAAPNNPFVWPYHQGIFRHILPNVVSLIYLPLDKMAAISQTAFLNTFSWMKKFEFWLKCHRNLFLMVQWTMTQHLFR